MRIWIGKEQEGKHFGELTLFVESNKLDSIVLNKVKQFIPNNCKRIYFGAGRVDVLKFDIELYDLLNYDIIIEQGIFNFNRLPKWVLNNWNVILTYRTTQDGIASLGSNITFKIDDFKQVCMYELKNIHTINLSTLNNGLYKNIDKILYEEREE